MTTYDENEGKRNAEDSPEVNHLKKLLKAEEAVPVQDYSTAIMQRIRQQQKTKRSSSPFRTRYAVAGKRLAVLAGLLAVLSGFAYAGNGWLGLWDKSGQLVMQIMRSREGALPNQQLRALDEVAAVLAPGQAAAVYFGSREDILQNKTDLILWTRAPVAFTDKSRFVQSLHVPLAQAHIPDDAVSGYGFQKANIYYLHEAGGPAPERSSFTFGRSADGVAYGYYTRQPGKDILSAELVYTKDKKTVRYSFGAAQLADTATLYVEEPDKRSVLSINGMDVYAHENELFWTEKIGDYSFDYTLSSPDLSPKELAEFAKAVIPAS